MGRSSGSFLINKADAKKILQPSIQLTDKEKDFRVKLYTDISKIKNENLKCTICLRNIATAVFGKGRFFRHSVLDVLLCEVCLDFYGDGDFSTDEDGDEKYCRWCGQGGKLYFCSKCTCAFCKKCVRQNLKRSEVHKLEYKDWNCFICRPKPLFPLRAECWAVQEYLQNENCKVKRASSRQRHSKRKHPTISEDLPKQTKMENQSPATKKSKLRDIQSSHDDSSCSDKDKPQEDWLKYSDCIGLIRVLEVILKNCYKSEKAENHSGCINRSKSPKGKSSGNTKQIINHDSTESHVSSKKSTTSVISNNNSRESKVFEDVKTQKEDKRIDLVDSGKRSKTNHSTESLVICSESKKTKTQIKLACDFLLSTNQNVWDLSTLMMDRVKLYEQMITPNSLKTLDDVFKTRKKLSKMLLCVNKNVSILQSTLERYMKNWAEFMDLSNTTNLNLFMFSKSEVKNKAERTGISELVEGIDANSENIKSINKDDTVRAVKSEKSEFPSGSDFEEVTNDAIQSCNKEY